MKKAIVGMMVMAMMGLSPKAFADKEVYSPFVQQGELEVEAKGLYDFDHAKDKNAVQEYKNSVGYGVTDRWVTEFYGEFERQPQEDDDGNIGISSVKFTHLEWENRYQLTRHGQYWLDAGLYFAYEIPVHKKDPGQIEGKILLEKSTGKWTHKANIIFNKEVGGGATQETTAGLALSSRYRLSGHVQPGIEYWIDFGQLRAHLPYDAQTHQIGPVVYGRLTRHVHYDIGFLFGISEAAPRGELKWVIEYEF